MTATVFADLEGTAAPPDTALATVTAALAGGYDDVAGTRGRSLVFPVPGSLPRRTPVRHLDCTAMFRGCDGRLWSLRTRGHPWTPPMLATAARLLGAVPERTPAAELALRVGFVVDCPVSIHDALLEPDDAIAAPRRTAGMLLLGMDLLAGTAAATPGTPLARRHALLEHGVRAALARERRRFAAALDPVLLARTVGGGAAVYNFLVTGSSATQRARNDLARTFPLLVPAAATDDAPEFGARVREIAESGAPFVRALARAIGVRPVVLKSLVGVPAERAGGGWSQRPRALLTLLDALRTEDLPGADDDLAWARFNEAVALAQRVFRRAPWTSPLALCWLRGAARGRWRMLERDAGEAAGLADRAAAIDAFHDAATEALTLLAEDRGTAAAAAPLAARVALDRRLAVSTPAALLRLAERFACALADARGLCAEEAGTLAGERFAPLLPADFVSSCGRRRVSSLSTPAAMRAHGRALGICLESSYAAHYTAECVAGNAFLLAFHDTVTGAPCATAELTLQRYHGTRHVALEVVQFTGRHNGVPSTPCLDALGEVLASVETKTMQAHLDRTWIAATERRRLDRTGRRRRARLLPIVHALGDAMGRAEVDALVAETQRLVAATAFAPC